MQSKTSNKRKSLGAKDVSQNSPSVNVKTPKQHQVKSVPKSPKENGTPNSKQLAQINKRKSPSGAVEGNGNEISAKKTKLGGLPGTNDLRLKGKPIEKNVTSLQKRQRTKSKWADCFKKVSSGDKDSIDKIKARIEAMNKNGKLTISGKKKLRKLVAILKKADVEVSGQDSSKSQPKLKKGQQGPVVKIVKDESDDNESIEEDEDLDSEEETDDDEAPKKVLPKKQQQKSVSAASPFAKGKKMQTRNGKKKAVQA